MNPPELADQLVNQAKTVIVASLTSGGQPDIRAMLAPRRREGLRHFWLTTNTSSRKVAEFEAQPAAALYFFNEASFTGLTLYGTMACLHDQASRRLIWQPTDTMYYAQGVDDPDFTVLRFSATAGRLYHGLTVEELNLETDS